MLIDDIKKMKELLRTMSYNSFIHGKNDVWESSFDDLFEKEFKVLLYKVKKI